MWRTCESSWDRPTLRDLEHTPRSSHTRTSRARPHDQDGGHERTNTDTNVPARSRRRRARRVDNPTQRSLRRRSDFVRTLLCRLGAGLCRLQPRRTPRCNGDASTVGPTYTTLAAVANSSDRANSRGRSAFRSGLATRFRYNRKHRRRYHPCRSHKSLLGFPGHHSPFGDLGFDRGPRAERSRHPARRRVAPGRASIDVPSCPGRSRTEDLDIRANRNDPDNPD